MIASPQRMLSAHLLFYHSTRNDALFFCPWEEMKPLQSPPGMYFSGVSVYLVSLFIAFTAKLRYAALMLCSFLTVDAIRLDRCAHHE